MSKLNRQDEMQVGDSSGFRLRTSVVDWQGRASGKRGQDRQLQQDQGRPSEVHSYVNGSFTEQF